jgi:hypothetical protein
VQLILGVALIMIEILFNTFYLLTISISPICLRRKIIKRLFEKSLWINSMKVLTYLPTFSKNQRYLKQILIDTDYTLIIYNRCGSKGIKKGEGVLL